jgi:predicted AAA+ superfamily ATPase
MEISSTESYHITIASLESRLIYGSFPEIILQDDNRMRKHYLLELCNAYLFKDILELEGIRHSDKLSRLLQLLIFQIGKEVSLNELGTQLGISKNTVNRYLDLLEKVFIIYQRNGFSRNLRKEITKNHRYYFYDNGICNALINNFNPLSMRMDTGALWENYITTERLKRNIYLLQNTPSYFWRTYDKKEIDLVEEREGRLHGFEIKWKPKRSIKPPSNWKTTYPQATFEVIHKDNYLPFIVS